MCVCVHVITHVELKFMYVAVLVEARDEHWVLFLITYLFI